MQHEEIFNLTKRLKAIASVGLLYSNNEYDKERYTEIAEISFELLHQISGQDITSLKKLYFDKKEYPTAKVDVRGLIIKDNKILLVKETADKRWSLPGGWGDIGYSPKEVIIKECKEETGLDVVPEKLLAVFDKKCHPHPPQPFYVYKMVFLCRAVSTEINKGFDVADVQYFDPEDLPALSEDRIVENQLKIVYEKALVPESVTYFD